MVNRLQHHVHLTDLLHITNWLCKEYECCSRTLFLQACLLIHSAEHVSLPKPVTKDREAEKLKQLHVSERQHVYSWSDAFHSSLGICPFKREHPVLFLHSSHLMPGTVPKERQQDVGGLCLPLCPPLNQYVAHEQEMNFRRCSIAATCFFRWKTVESLHLWSFLPFHSANPKLGVRVLAVKVSNSKPCGRNGLQIWL